jgi:RNA polymerase sigma factor (sigma-70 family)
LQEPGIFPSTRHSVVRAARDPDPGVRREAFESLISAYWRPVYKYLRLKWRADADEAADLTQAFFLTALEKGTFASFDPAKARFRTFLRSCVDHFTANDRKAARRLKRGGGQEPLSLDFRDAEGELAGVDPPDPFDLEEYFHREWIRSLFALAVGDLERRYAELGKTGPWEAFRRYDLDAEEGRRPSYAQLAAELGAPVTQVTNWLHAARRDLRARVLARLRQTTGSAEELREESRLVLGLSR